MAEPERRVNIYHPTFGKTISIPASDVESALKDGWQLEAPESSAERYYQKKYGDAPVQTFLEGAADTLSLGGYSAFARAVGDEEGVRERAARHPIARPAGEIVGAVASIPFAGGGGGAAGTIMRATPAGLATRAATAIERNAATALAGGESMLARAAARVAPPAVGAATEGALFGAGQGASEVLLSDDPGNAEAILNTIADRSMTGAVIGGGLGAGVGAVGGLLSRAPKVRPAGASPADELRASLQARDDEVLATMGARDIAQDVLAGDPLLGAVAARREAQEGLTAQAAAARVEAESIQAAIDAEKASIAVAPRGRGKKPAPSAETTDRVAADTKRFRDEATELHKRVRSAQVVGWRIHDAHVAGPEAIAKLTRPSDQSMATALTDPAVLRQHLEELGALQTEWAGSFAASRRYDPAEAEAVMARMRARPGTVEWPRDPIYEFGLTDDALHAAIRDERVYATHEALKEKFLDVLRTLNTNKQYINEFAQGTARGNAAKDLLAVAARIDQGEALGRIADKATPAALRELTERYKAIQALALSSDQIKAKVAKQFMDQVEALGIKATREDLKAIAKVDGIPVPPEGGLPYIALKAQSYAKSAELRLVELEQEMKLATGGYKQALSEQKAARTALQGQVKRMGEKAVRAEKVSSLASGTAGIVSGLASGWLFAGPFGSLLGVGLGGALGVAVRYTGRYVARNVIRNRLLRARGTSDKRISDGIGAFVKGKAKGSISSPYLKTGGGALFRSLLQPDRKTKERSTEEAAKARALEVRKAAANPLGSSQTLFDRLGDIRAVDLPLYDQLDTLFRKGLDFLASKAPAPPDPQPFRRSPWHLSPSDVDRFARYYAVALDGEGPVMEALASGRLTVEHVEALKATRPAMYERIRAQLTANLLELRADLPYEKRLQLGVLFGVPVDQSQEPQRIAALQGTFETAAQAEADQGGISKQDIGSVKLKAEVEPTTAQRHTAA